jgi:hypothetical protein
MTPYVTICLNIVLRYWPFIIRLKANLDLSSFRHPLVPFGEYRLELIRTYVGDPMRYVL